MDKKFVMNNYNRSDIVFVKGQGSWLVDSSGKKYLDFVAGIAVNCLGHCHPAIVDTIGSQSRQLMHISNLYWTNEQIALASRLAELSGLSSVFFCNSGAEANEAAMKIARKHGRKKDPAKNIIVYMKDSFHGRTLGALSITGQEKYQEKFRPLIDRVLQVDFNDADGLEAALSKSVCGVFIEPIQGESGIVEASPEFLRKARELCDRHDALLIFDEVQCGIGRTGSLFAFQNYGILPDVATLAKGLGAGFPIGAAIAGGRASDVFEPGDHGSTFGGNPLACSVALTVLDQLTNHGVLDSLEEKSRYIRSRLKGFQQTCGLVEEIRGKGLILGVKCREASKDVIARCQEKGLLVVGAGGEVIRIIPALNISTEDIACGLDILEEALAETESALA